MAISISVLAMLLCVPLKIVLVETKSVNEIISDAMKEATANISDPMKNEQGFRFGSDGIMRTPASNKRLYDLDIVIPDTTEEVRERNANGETRAAIRWGIFRWHNDVIPYKISDGFDSSDRQKILFGMSEWEKYTCITFREKRLFDFNYLNILPNKDGCWSFVGRMFVAQDLNLQTGSPGCVFNSIIIHELGHAIGYFHEHSRPDRDEYIAVRWENVESGWESQFKKLTAFSTVSFSVPYDYVSVMHYDKNAAADPPSAITIETKDSAFQDLIGESPTLSFRDAAGVNEMYGCADKCDGYSYWPLSPEYYLGEDCVPYCPDEDGFSIVPCTGNPVQPCENTGSGCFFQWLLCPFSSSVQTRCGKTCNSC